MTEVEQARAELDAAIAEVRACMAAYNAAYSEHCALLAMERDKMLARADELSTKFNEAFRDHVGPLNPPLQAAAHARVAAQKKYDRAVQNERKNA